MLLPRPKKTGKKLRTPNFIFIGVWQPCLITQYSKHWKHYGSFHTCDWGNIRIHCNIRCDTIYTILYFYTDVSTTQTYSVSDPSVICYLPQRSWGKVMFLHMSVILFTGGLPQCLLGYPPPREQFMLGDTHNKRAVRILLECILVTSFIANVDTNL